MANAKGKGRGGKNNFQHTRIPDPTTPEEMSTLQKALRETYDAYKQPKVKSDDELVKRFDEYFKKCVDRNSVPTVEEMFLYTGYGYSGLHDIEIGHRKGFSPDTAYIIKKAKDYLKSLDGKLATMGEINFLAYCFRAKNYYGMVDKVEHIIAPPVENELIDTKSIKERYQLEDSIDVEIKKD